MDTGRVIADYMLLFNLQNPLYIVRGHVSVLRELLYSAANLCKMNRNDVSRNVELQVS
jgi:hypothetical protein